MTSLKMKDLPPAIRKRIKNENNISTPARDPKIIQEQLFKLLKSTLPKAEVIYDSLQPVKGRKYRLDIAIPAIKLGIEVLGWQYHGKHLNSFKQDILRHNDIVAEGWLIYYVAAGRINSEPADVVGELLYFISRRYPEFYQSEVCFHGNIGT